MPYYYYDIFCRFCEKIFEIRSKNNVVPLSFQCPHCSKVAIGVVSKTQHYPSYFRSNTDDTTDFLEDEEFKSENKYSEVLKSQSKKKPPRR